MLDMDSYKSSIAAVCQNLKVKRLDIFGSATKPGFGPDSDIDILALFDRQPGNMFDRFFDLKERLEGIFNRPVDLVLDDSIKNPYFRKSVDQSRVNIYESENT